MASNDLELVGKLLFEEEGPALDFKREQYRFAGATDRDKSELLKDILAFANAWRRSDAYILIGVEEVKGAKGIVVGIADDLDDAQLQQFVNSKTQRPVNFSHRALSFGGAKIGLLHVPVQQRPFYLKRDYGKLSKSVVYVRRGSSTAVADPDEIARMGQDHTANLQVLPKLDLSLGESEYEGAIGRAIQVAVKDLVVPSPEEIPDYRKKSSVVFGAFNPLERINPDYYRELAKYVRVAEARKGFYFIVRNEGDIVAHDVRVFCEIPRKEGLILHDCSNKPRRPQRKHEMFMVPVSHSETVEPWDLTVGSYGNNIRVEAEIGKIQPKATVRTIRKLYVGARSSGVYNVSALVYSDDLPQPAKFDLSFDVQVVQEEANIDRLEELNHERIISSDFYRKYKDSVSREE